MKKHVMKQKHLLKRCYSTINKQKKLLKPPKTLCVHMNRLEYNNMGMLQLNRTKVDFPIDLDLNHVSGP